MLLPRSVLDTSHIPVLIMLQFSILLAAAVRAHHSSAYLRIMNKLLHREVDDDEPSLEHHSMAQLQWSIELIAGASSQAGTELLNCRHVIDMSFVKIITCSIYRPQLSRLLSLTLNDTRKAVVKAGATLLTRV